MHTSLESQKSHVQALTIGDLIEVPPVKTVIELEGDREDSQTLARSFVFTSDVFSHYAVLANALLKDSGQGYFLEGDFGSGKSHFLAALCAWLEERPGVETLTANHPELRRLGETRRRFLAVDISLVKYRSSTSLEQIIVTSIERALAARGYFAELSPLAQFLKTFYEALVQAELVSQFARQQSVQAEILEKWIQENPRQAYRASLAFSKQHGLPAPEVFLEDRFETFRRVLEEIKKAGLSGMVLCIDELSEFFRAKPDASKLNEDARTLQFLGELSNSQPLWIIAALQESIERTGDISQQTLRKIKDRFPIKLALSTLHIRELISGRLIRKKEGATERIRQIYDDYRRHFSSFDCALSLFTSIYPVHPITLSLLEGLGDLFSEHRGIVDFLYSRLVGDPRRHIEGLLSRPAAELLAPDSIYEHFAPRLAEYSAFHVYPRHIIPHLDEVINRVIEDDLDRGLARRLVRILVLYRIHPTAKPPSVELLAELVACMIAVHDPQFNSRYVSEVLLDPLVQESQFLAKRSEQEFGFGLERGKEKARVFYEVVTEENPRKTFQARIAQIAKELSVRDSRLFLDPLRELKESSSWPGPGLWNGFLKRSVLWRQTTRHVLLAFLDDDEMEKLVAQIKPKLEEFQCDFALIVTLNTAQASISPNILDESWSALWKIPALEEIDLLREYLSIRLLAEELQPSNPAHASLCPFVTEDLTRLEPQVEQILLRVIYQGEFLNPGIRFETSARELRRFDRLLEAAGEHLLSKRYRKFLPIAPTTLPPSPRLYQRLFTEFVTPGKLSIQEARNKGLTEAIETLALPLGIVEVRSGSYLLTPDPLRYLLLEYCFQFLSATSSVNLPHLLHELQFGPFGLPRETAHFLLASLAHSGLISLLSAGRVLPLEFLHLGSLESAQTVALGELLSKADRDILIQHCQFLFGTEHWESFGLKQQREAWQATLKLKSSMEVMLEEIQRAVVSIRTYSAFESFNFSLLDEKISRLQRVLSEIKVSYAAREGLERFLRAWRDAGLESEDILFLKKVRQFFSRGIEQCIFIAHYVRHPAVVQTVSEEKELLPLYDSILHLLQEPERLIIADNGQELEHEFQLFRESYSELYLQAHTKFSEGLAPAKLNKQSNRVFTVLRQLAGIESLDRPQGLTALLGRLEPASKTSCRRNVVEELRQSPLCGCGFQVDTSKSPNENFNEQTLPTLLDQALKDYVSILSSSEVLEPVVARAYALQDMQPEVAERLRDFCEILQSKKSLSNVALLDFLDSQTLKEVDEALARNTLVQRRDVSSLVGQLAGRRLSSTRIMQVVQNWIGNVTTETILALDGENSLLDDRQDKEKREGRDGREGVLSDSNFDSPSSFLWPHLRPDLFPSALSRKGICEKDITSLQRALAKEYPREEIRKVLSQADTHRLLKFIVEEPCFTLAIQEGWLLFVERILHQQHDSSFCVPVESRHLFSPERTALCERLTVLSKLQQMLTRSFPERLRARLLVASILSDPWCSKELFSSTTVVIEEMAKKGQDWLQTLSSLEPIKVDERLVVIIVDAVPVDVWLEVLEKCRHVLAPRMIERWFRLDGEAKTVPALQALFGLSSEEDPSDVFASRGIAYQHFEGNESRTLTDMIPVVLQERPGIVRLRVFDRSAHRGSMRLHDMPQVFGNILERQLVPMIQTYLANKKKVVLTSDHGLSFFYGQLGHGEGGVYEQAIFRGEWEPVE